MITKTIFYFFLSLNFCYFTYLPAQNWTPKVHQEQAIEDYDTYIQSLASLIFHLDEWEETLKAEEKAEDESIFFSNEDVSLLWEKVSHPLYRCHSINQMEREHHFEKAYKLYQKADNLVSHSQNEEARHTIRSCSKLLQILWEEAIDLEEKEAKSMSFPLLSLTLRSKIDPNIEDNPYIPSKTKKKMSPYLLPLKHPMRTVLDHLCLKTRVIANSKSFRQAGFKTLDKRPRSYIRVASHEKMPGYLVKAYLDTELKEKQRKPSWEWLTQRCEGAEKILKIIQDRQLKHFVVAKKWIYCFPAEPSPPQDGKHTRHFALLLVTDMDLVPKRQNLYAWEHYITKEHLKELYLIISRAKGSSYRADNIAYTYKGKFAFIDTEYPSSKPDFKRIRHYLNHDMRDYWDHLVKNGGS